MRKLGLFVAAENEADQPIRMQKDTVRGRRPDGKASELLPRGPGAFCDLSTRD
jgi:hypothetical protein